VALAERAYQHAVAHARDRVQSRDVAGSSGPVPIIRHPDVRRMLMTMRALTEGARSLAYYAAGLSDVAHHAADEAERRRAVAAYEFLVPIVKGWSTEMSVEATSLGIQVHGGMGFIEETGAAQFYRDARILPIYEGTTAIQANDLIGRKTARDGGAVAREFVGQMRETAAALAADGDARLASVGARLATAADGLAASIEAIVGHFRSDAHSAYSGSVPYLMQAGLSLSAWQLGRAALAARELLGRPDVDKAFLEAKIVTAQFFAEHLLPRAAAHAEAVAAGGQSTMALDDATF